MIKKKEFSSAQNIAANPQENVWVQANAGTGKTSVLTERLLRILFRTHDVTASGILCLTYTNAGAGEMRNRILRELKKWALLSNEDMRILLDGVATNKKITDNDIAHAREIFFTYIDKPDMLKIKTVHGFCEEVLHRFPIEAHISPAWKLIMDADQRALLWDAFNDMILNPANEHVESAFSHLLNRVSEYTIDNLLGILSEHYKDFFDITNYIKYRKYFVDTTTNFLKINNEISMEKPLQKLENIVVVAREKQSKKNPPKYLQDVIDLTTKYIKNLISFDEYKSVYLTKAGTKNSNISKQDFLVDEQSRVFALNEYMENKKIFDDTIALFDLSGAFAQSYMGIKRARNILDFEDLILYTRKLFSNPDTMGWILSQMDVSLSHILVDEAQDTSPAQWDIIRMLTGDFFDNGDNTDLPRSLFVVGDTKQSIYGFQGADPVAFIKSRDDIAAQIENNYRVIRDIPLDQNFRSLPSVLYAVDTFFKDDIVKSTSGFINQTHKCFRVHDGTGAVELHRLNAKGISGDDVRDYVKTIADKISNLVDSGAYRPDDIMVLVQNRRPFVNPLVAELKKRNIDVAGSDRIVLPNFPAIRDLLNLTRFCLNTADDYSLCCVLKSPLYRFTETDIYKLCKLKNDAVRAIKQSGDTTNIPSIYNLLPTFNMDVYNDLTNLVNVAAKLAPYSFFSFVLRNNNTRQKMISALGNQILDPLEEFMTICLAYERTQSGTLREFLKWFITGGAEVKRDMDATSGVRVVTVHGSKGLEAPVVFLIDTVRTPDADKIVKLPCNPNPEFKTPWIWMVAGATKTESAQTALDKQSQEQIAEYYRLLYVAMTRARDELYIYGYTSNKNPTPLSWHANLWRVFGGIYNTTENQEYIRIEYDKSNK